MPLAELFTTLIYQPFFNILVFFYWVLGLVTQGNPDMGVAVILLTILIRILLLPMSLAGDKSEAERRQIAKTIADLEVTFATDPVALKQHKKMVLRRSRKVLAGELLSLAVQIAISLMLWRIFASGLKGEDLHLLYSFMPEVETPFNLVFLGRFDLGKASFFLNLLQSICIFVLETLSIYSSPYPPEKGEVVRLQLVLPVVSFLVFMFLPAGKKLFIIATLIISILITLYKFIKHRYQAYKLKQEEKEAELVEGTEKVVVEVK